jgi:hypothetical protein
VRTYDEFNTLHERLVSTEDVQDIQKFPFLPGEGEESETALGQYLQQLIWYFGDDIWHCQPLLLFMDNNTSAVPPSSIHVAQVNAMTNKVRLSRTRTRISPPIITYVNQSLFLIPYCRR